MTKVKICGITNLKDAEVCVEAGADALGFVFAESPRCISLKRASQIIKRLPPSVMSVGVFVDAREDEVQKTLKECLLDALQFHGKESPSYCNKFKSKSLVIKAFRIKDKKSLKAIPKYNVDMYLLDTYLKEKPGGTGITFNWKLARGIQRYNKPIVLSGGLNPDNVTDAIKTLRPYMVDGASSLEKSAGRKDYRLVREFIEKIKKTQAYGA